MDGGKDLDSLCDAIVERPPPSLISLCGALPTDTMLSVRNVSISLVMAELKLNHRLKDSSVHRLKDLRLFNCGLHANLRPLVDALKHATHVTALELSESRIDVEDAICLAEMSNQLTSLTVRHNHYKVVADKNADDHADDHADEDAELARTSGGRWVRMRILAAGAAILLEAAHRSPTLEILNLSPNHHNASGGSGDRSKTSEWIRQKKIEQVLRPGENRWDNKQRADKLRAYRAAKRVGHDPNPTYPNGLTTQQEAGPITLFHRKWASLTKTASQRDNSPPAPRGKPGSRRDDDAHIFFSLRADAFDSKLLGSKQPKKALRLSDCMLPMDAVELATAFRKDRCITSLDLSTSCSRRIGPVGCIELADALREHPAIASIDLRGNLVLDEGGRSFLPVLKKQPATLTNLDLRCNHIGGPVLAELHEAAVTSHVMKSLCGIELSIVSRSLSKSKRAELLKRELPALPKSPPSIVTSSFAGWHEVNLLRMWTGLELPRVDRLGSASEDHIRAFITEREVPVHIHSRTRETLLGVSLSLVLPRLHPHPSTGSCYGALRLVTGPQQFDMSKDPEALGKRMKTGDQPHPLLVRVREDPPAVPMLRLGDPRAHFARHFDADPMKQLHVVSKIVRGGLAKGSHTSRADALPTAEETEQLATKLQDAIKAALTVFDALIEHLRDSRAEDEFGVGDPSVEVTAQQEAACQRLSEQAAEERRRWQFLCDERQGSEDAATATFFPRQVSQDVEFPVDRDLVSQQRHWRACFPASWHVVFDPRGDLSPCTRQDMDLQDRESLQDKTPFKLSREVWQNRVEEVSINLEDVEDSDVEDLEDLIPSAMEQSPRRVHEHVSADELRRTVHEPIEDLQPFDTSLDIKQMKLPDGSMIFGAWKALPDGVIAADEPMKEQLEAPKGSEVGSTITLAEEVRLYGTLE